VNFRKDLPMQMGAHLATMLSKGADRPKRERHTLDFCNFRIRFEGDLWRHRVLVENGLGVCAFQLKRRLNRTSFMEARMLSAEGLAILEALIGGASSTLLSDSVLRALQETGLVEHHGEGWALTELGHHSLSEARERLHAEPRPTRGFG
jgi:hypothetical protein